MKTAITLVVTVLLFATPAAADDFAFWPEGGYKYKGTDVLAKGNVQLRLRDNASDWNYFRAEGGLGFASGNFEGYALYRYNPGKSGGNWNTAHYLLLDPTLKSVSVGAFSLDVRGRLQLKLGDRGRSFVRVRPNFKRSVAASAVDSWYVNNEFFFQISDLGARARVNQNRFSFGIKIPAGASADLTPYYLLRSDQSVSGGSWFHTHVAGVTLYFKN